MEVAAVGSVPCNSIFLKGLAVIPGIGMLVGIVATDTLTHAQGVAMEQMREQPDNRELRDHASKISTARAHYATSATIRNILTVAALVTLVALGVAGGLLGPFLIFLSIFFGLAALSSLFSISNQLSRAYWLIHPVEHGGAAGE